MKVITFYAPSIIDTFQRKGPFHQGDFFVSYSSVPMLQKTDFEVRLFSFKSRFPHFLPP